MTTSIRPNLTYTLREIKRFVEAYPVLSADTPLTNDYRAGKRDAYSSVAAKLSEWIDES